MNERRVIVSLLEELLEFVSDPAALDVSKPYSLWGAQDDLVEEVKTYLFDAEFKADALTVENLHQFKHLFFPTAGLNVIVTPQGKVRYLDLASRFDDIYLKVESGSDEDELLKRVVEREGIEFFDRKSEHLEHILKRVLKSTLIQTVLSVGLLAGLEAYVRYENGAGLGWIIWMGVPLYISWWIGEGFKTQRTVSAHINLVMAIGFAVTFLFNLVAMIGFGVGLSNVYLFLFWLPVLAGALATLASIKINWI